MYKDIYKDVFVDRHKKANMIKDCANFLKKIEELKVFLVKFNKDIIMRSKIYPSNYIVRSEDSQSIIIITHNKCTFSLNDRI